MLDTTVRVYDGLVGEGGAGMTGAMFYCGTQDSGSGQAPRLLLHISGVISRPSSWSDKVEHQRRQMWGHSPSYLLRSLQ